MGEIYFVELEFESILTNVTSGSYQSRWNRVWEVKMKKSSMREQKILSFFSTLIRNLSVQYYFLSQRLCRAVKISCCCRTQEIHTLFWASFGPGHTIVARICFTSKLPIYNSQIACSYKLLCTSVSLISFCS